ncbi:MAG: regulatory signaling modulator protein AmpE [Gammaproteobacteria bacterium]|nr:regulatory signaling modulator protein AmpE [Gammaproteobacteria bacterium]
MNLISILIALLVETLYKPVSDYRRYDWLLDASSKIYHKLSDQPWRDGAFGLLLMVSLPCFAVWLIAAMLAGVASLFSFLFGLLVLIYCIGPKDLLDDVRKFTDALQANDADAAGHYASEILGQKVTADMVPLAQQVKESIPVIANTRVLGVLFWFMLMGPVGAMLFRYVCLLNHQVGWSSGFSNALERVFEMMLWPSARLSVIGFALTGSFVDTLSNWQSSADFWQRNSEELLRVSGIGAVRHEQDELPEEGQPDIEGVQNILALMKRTLIVWLAILALLTLTGLVL